MGTGHDDFHIAMQRFNADIVAINETWLREGQEERAPVVPGYRFRNTPRPASMRRGRGGGVGFYIKCGVRARLVSHPTADIEQMWLTVTLNGRKYIIGTAYRPNWVNIDIFFDALTESVTSFTKFDNIILMGDFNINMLDISDVKTTKFKMFLHCMGLEQVVNDPTHYSPCNDTLIDVVCTDAPIRNVLVSNITGTLGHAMINVIRRSHYKFCVT